MRVFFAIFPPPEAAERLADLARAQADAHGGKATRAETIHLTLAFLGDVDSERLPQLIDVARQTPAQNFALEIDFCGYWRHNRLVWAGVSAPPPALLGFAAGLRAGLAAAGFLVDRAPGCFTPHVTLVRKVNSNGAWPRQALAEAITWPCQDFALVGSRLGAAAGSTYDRVAGFALDASEE